MISLINTIKHVNSAKKTNLVMAILAVLAIVYFSGKVGAGEFLNNHVAFGYGGSGVMALQPVIAVNQPLYFPSLNREGRLFHKAENNMLLELEIPPTAVPTNVKGYSVFTIEDLEVNPGLEPTCQIQNASVVGNRLFNTWAKDVETGEYIRDFVHNLTISLTIPELPPDTSNLGVYYLDAHNRWSLIQKAYFDPQNKTAFQVDNLAVFAVINVSGLPKIIESQGNCFPAPNAILAKQVLGSKKYANGSLLRTPDGRIYIVEKQELRYIKDFKEIEQKYSGRKIYNIEASEIQNIYSTVDGKSVLASEINPVVKSNNQQVLGVKYKSVNDRIVYADGAFVRTPDNKVYVIENPTVRHIATLEKSITQWAGRKVYNISYDELELYRNQRVVPEIQEVTNIEKYKEGDILRTRDWKVYIVENNTVRHIATLPGPDAQYYEGKKINDVDYGTLYHYQDRRVPSPPQAVLGVKKYAAGSLVRTPDSKIYLVQTNSLKHIATLSELATYAGQKIYNISYSDAQAYWQSPTTTTGEIAGGPQKVLGVKQYADGTLLRTKDWKLYLVTSQKIKHIATFPGPDDRYQGKKILDVDFAVIAEYEVLP